MVRQMYHPVHIQHEGSTLRNMLKFAYIFAHKVVLAGPRHPALPFRGDLLFLRILFSNVTIFGSATHLHIFFLSTIYLENINNIDDFGVC